MMKTTLSTVSVAALMIGVTTLIPPAVFSAEEAAKEPAVLINETPYSVTLLQILAGRLTEPAGDKVSVTQQQLDELKQIAVAAELVKERGWDDVDALQAQAQAQAQLMLMRRLQDIALRQLLLEDPEGDVAVTDAEIEAMYDDYKTKYQAFREKVIENNKAQGVDQPIPELEPLEGIRSALEDRARRARALKALEALTKEASIEVNEDLVIVAPAQKN